MLQFSQIQERLYAAALLEMENRQVNSLPTVGNLQRDI